MFVVVANEVTLLKELGLYSDPVEVYDTEGQLLGLYVPANLGQGKGRSALAVPPTDWAEIERRRQSGGEAAPWEVVKERLQLLELEAERRRAAGEKEMTDEEVTAFMDRHRRPEPVGPHLDGSDGSGGRAASLGRD